MIKRLIIIFLFLSIPLKAEIVTEKGKHRHVGNISKNQSCKIAEQKAKKNAIIKSIGQTISSDVVSNCLRLMVNLNVKEINYRYSNLMV